jgi:hypothetical protein
LVLFVRIGTFQRVTANPNNFSRSLSAVVLLCVAVLAALAAVAFRIAVDGVIHSRSIMRAIPVFSKELSKKLRGAPTRAHV